jgi:hypothetical protein
MTKCEQCGKPIKGNHYFVENKDTSLLDSKGEFIAEGSDTQEKIICPKCKDEIWGEEVGEQ